MNREAAASRVASSAITSALAVVEAQSPKSLLAHHTRYLEDENERLRGALVDTATSAVAAAAGTTALAGAVAADALVAEHEPTVAVDDTMLAPPLTPDALLPQPAAPSQQPQPDALLPQPVAPSQQPQPDALLPQPAAPSQQPQPGAFVEVTGFGGQPRVRL